MRTIRAARIAAFALLFFTAGLVLGLYIHINAESTPQPVCPAEAPR